jgi:chromosome segregation ATPase
VRASERSETQARTSRDALVERDTTIAQILHSLGERDAQLSALQREHAKIVPDLEARSKAGAQLEAELKSARDRAEALARDLTASRQSVADLTTRVSRREAEINDHRRELSAAKASAESYLENLRSRVWRGAYNQNLFLEWDEKMDVARSGQSALQSECDRLKLMAAAMNTKLAEQNETIVKLGEAKAGDAAALSKRAQELEAATRAKEELQTQIDALTRELKGVQAELDTERKRLQGELDAERKRLQGELDSERKHLRGELEAEQKRRQGETAGHAREVAQTRALEAAETERVRSLLAAAEARHADFEQQLARFQDEAKTHEDEMSVLMAHLTEARRPVQSFQADVKRLTEELAAKSASVDQLAEDNRSLRATLERTRGALEERELLIRRLERSASNNANVLGRLQTSIERLGTTPATAAAPTTEFTAELVRIDGDRQMSFPLGRRTRIGRAPGCELQIDSQSVSRNHAMILKGTRELIVEDLNSTNGVVVNGRRVSRNLLTDGDVLTIGEIQFRCVLKPNPRSAQVAEGNVAAPAAAGAHASKEGAAAEVKADAAKAETRDESGQGESTPGESG